MTDAGLMGYNSIWPLIIILGLMLFGSMSFITHYRAFSKRSIIEYFKDKTIWVYTGIIIFFFLFVMLKFSKLIPFHTLFYLISSATGGVNLFGANIHQAFPDFFKAILIFLMFIGASTASTGGGIKIQRFVIIIKSVWWKVKSILLPKNSLFRREFNGDMVTDNVISDVMSFALIYGLFILLGTFIFVALGYGALDSLLEITSVQTNIGLSVGIIGPSLSVIGKMTAIILMFVGRLEIIPVLVLFGFIFNIRPWRK
jgi:trk system potassium uptake protein TrkH